MSVSKPCMPKFTLTTIFFFDLLVAKTVIPFILQVLQDTYQQVPCVWLLLFRGKCI